MSINLGESSKIYSLGPSTEHLRYPELNISYYRFIFCQNHSFLLCFCPFKHYCRSFFFWNCFYPYCCCLSKQSKIARNCPFFLRGLPNLKKFLHNCLRDFLIKIVLFFYLAISNTLLVALNNFADHRFLFHCRRD